MSLRQKVRRVFRRSSNGSKSKDNTIKIEYYRRHEIPPSKFKGPFDREHQKALAAWSFTEAQADRPRSPDLSLSPCATLPDYLRPRVEEDDVAPDELPSVAPEDLSDTSATISDNERAQERQENSGSTSSTAYEADSYSSSMMTLFDEGIRQNSIAQLKESIRYTSPVVRAISPPPLSPKGSYMPFSPDDLTRALNAVQICG
ncbi:hypothetical protein ETB97_004443 [Aspergillus alliaceus]|uniref:Uncharacterized protein n=1 Tax=Petromyces alliaceus TaxID=209559 RepID=A0A5N7CI53_PETAA|nr:uncharacterized protein BDW43DRAFT_310310 [Aspergillus alliaceus]KAB8234282.1 hypothetical protein BDW43DRAFT_310310 [Aspergillus alliaceus]KAE8393569.1 hypothetical protein BDV23DRAFT_149413 [Aspergillus alliaceus]KAF5858365.1 hypothetical protein ETB97_004443 [Aspergillus burnettii]